MTSPVSHYEDFYSNLDKELSSIDSTYKSVDKKITTVQKSFNNIVKLNPIVICSGVFLISIIFLLLFKPKMVRKKDDGENIKKIAPIKLIIFATLITLPFVLFYMMKFKLIVK